MAEAMVTVEQQHANFGDVFDENKQMRREIKALAERVRVLEYGMWTQALKVQELEQTLCAVLGWRADAQEQVNEIMGA